MSKETKAPKTGQEITPEVTGEITPETSPEDIGHLSGGEYQQFAGKKKGGKNG